MEPHPARPHPHAAAGEGVVNAIVVGAAIIAGLLVGIPLLWFAASGFIAGWTMIFDDISHWIKQP